MEHKNNETVVKKQPNEGMLIPKIFQYKTSQIGTIQNEDTILFVAKDVCDVLGLGNAREAITSLDDDEKLKSVILTSGQKREVNVITESGMYALIFRSRKPEAKKFRKWVTSVVLPTIRKTGKYQSAYFTQKAELVSQLKHLQGLAKKAKTAAENTPEYKEYTRIQLEKDNLKKSLNALEDKHFGQTALFLDFEPETNEVEIGNFADVIARRKKAALEDIAKRNQI
ncbi:BRO family protein [Bernardetia sp. Wsw4-3y2]|uniref:BRO-N domain-containing protein n=1 Tax=Bernardetia sp. Wsw4-3y2 TaxID=3127471 RepID=UPI0030D0EA8C